MGAVSSSELTPSQLEQTLPQDLQVLHEWTDTLLVDPHWISHTFPHAVHSKLIQLPQQWTRHSYKRDKTAQKLVDIDQVLASRVSRDTLDLYLKKKVKYLQRDLAFIVHNEAPVRHAVEVREQMMKRWFLAYYRMNYREKKYGFVGDRACSEEEKKAVLADVLTGKYKRWKHNGDDEKKNEFVELDHEFIEMALEYAKYLPNLKTLTCIFGIPDKKEIPASKSDADLSISNDAPEQQVSEASPEVESPDNNHEEDDEQDSSPVNFFSNLIGGVLQNDAEHENLEMQIESMLSQARSPASVSRSRGGSLIFGRSSSRLGSARAAIRGLDRPVLSPRSGGIRAFFRDIGLQGRPAALHNTLTELFESHFGTNLADASPINAKDIKFDSWDVKLMELLELLLQKVFEVQMNVSNLNCEGLIDAVLSIQKFLTFCCFNGEKEERNLSFDCFLKLSTSILKHIKAYVRFSPFSIENLNNSIVCKLLPLCVTFLHFMVQQNEFSDLAFNLFTDLSDLLEILATKNIELSNSSDVVSSLTETNYKTVESLHSYCTRTITEQVVSFEGATHLVLQFDPKCHTERGLDVLDIVVGNQVLHQFHGNSRHWPKDPVIISNSDVLFRFRSDSNLRHWGYKCFIYAVKLHPTFSVFSNALHSLAHVTALSAKICIAGRTLEENEGLASKWLNSPLFRQGFENFQDNSQLSKDILDSNRNSKVGKMLDGLSRKLPFHGTDILGGKVVDEVVRLFHCVLIRHLGLDPVISKLAYDENLSEKSRNSLSEKVLEVLAMGKKLRQWIVSEKQRFQLLHSDLIARKAAAAEKNSQESKGNDGNAEIKLLSEVEYASKRLTYDGLCDDLIQKLRFLLKVKPSWSKLPSTSSDFKKAASYQELDLALNVSEVRKLARINSSESRQETLQLWKSVFNTWDTLQKWVVLKSQRTGTKTQNVTSLPDLIFLFIQSSISLGEVKKMIDVHCKRAQFRALALENVCNLMKIDSDVRVTFLAQLSCPFREYSPYRDYPNGGHIFRSMESASPELRERVEKAFSNYLSTLCELACGLDRETLSLRKLCINSFTVELLPADHSLFESQDLINLISQYCSGTEFDSLLKRSITYFTEICCGFGALKNYNDDRSYDVFQQSLLDRIAINLRNVSAEYIKVKADILKGKSIQINSEVHETVIRCESNCFSLLLQISSLCCSAISIQYFCSFSMGNLFLQLFQGGSYRIQRVALMILERIFPVLSPKEMNGNFEMLREFLPLSFSRQNFNVIQFFFLFAGSGLFVHANLSDDLQNKKVDFKTASAKRNICLQVLTFLCTLLTYDAWKEEIKALVFQQFSSLNHLFEIMQKIEVLDSDVLIRVYFAMTSICVCGGSPARINNNCFVKTRSVSYYESGSLLDFNRDSRKAKVIFESSKRVVDVNFEKIECVAPFSESLLSQEIISFACSGLLKLKDFNASKETGSVLLCIQFRSALLRCMSTSMIKGKYLKCLLESGILSFLAEVAVASSPLEEFRSAEYLEECEEALLELISDHYSGIANERIVYEPKTQVEILEHSPFKNEPLHLPSSFDSASAISLKFLDFTRRAVSFIENTKSFIGISKANYLIPSSLPAFYFEVNLINLDSSKGSWNAAIGLIREGFSLEGLPGMNSFAISVKEGLVHSNNGELPFCVPFVQGDILGVGWNLRNSTVYFTKNGNLIGNPFNDVKGRFYPCVWIEGIGTTLSINFGQDPFCFDFSSTLPSGYLDKGVNLRGSTLSAAAIARRTEALTLNALYPDFPLEICVVALENSNDDLMIAANWLIEHGWSEVERMVNDAIARSAEEAEEKLLSEYLHEEKKQNPVIISNNDDDREDFSSILVNNDPQRSSRVYSGLDDEVEVDIPIGIEVDEVKRNDDQQIVGQAQVSDSEGITSEIDTVSIDALKPGQILTVSDLSMNILHLSEHDYTDITKILGRNATVVDIDLNSKKVSLEIIDDDESRKYRVWVNVMALHKPRKGWTTDPYFLFQFDELILLNSNIAKFELAAAISKSRNTLLEVIKEWPHSQNFNFSVLGGAEKLFDLLKLTAAQHISYGSLKSRFMQNASLQSSSLFSFALKLLQPGNSPTDLSASHEVTDSLVALCIEHILNSIKYPPPTVIRQSAHPYAAHSEVMEKIHIPGATKLLVTFDSRCHLSTDMLTKLGFYKDENYEELVLSANGKGAEKFHNFIVPGNTFFFKFTSSGDAKYWGYKFTVSPIELRFGDDDAKKSKNFEFGIWLFNFLIENLNTDYKPVFLQKAFDALLLYVQQAKLSQKQMGAEMFIRVLLDLAKMRDQPVKNLEGLSFLRKQIDSYLVRGGSIDGSSLIQCFIELLAVGNMLKEKNELHLIAEDSRQFFSELGKYSLNLIDAISFLRISIDRASYGLTDSGDSALQRDVTEQMKNYCSQFGTSCFILPKNLSLIPFLSKHNDDILLSEVPQKSKKLYMKFKVHRMSYDPKSRSMVEQVLKETEVAFSNEPEVSNMTEEKAYVIIKADESIFDRLEEMSLFVSRNETKLGLPSYFTCQSAKIEKISLGMLDLLVNPKTLTLRENGFALPDPHVTDHSYEKFTLSFWLKPSFTDESLVHDRNIIAKGHLSHKFYPQVSFQSKQRTMTVSVYTTSGLLKWNSKNSLDQDLWSFVVLVCDGLSISLYINGTFDGKLEFAGALGHPNDCPFYIGHLPEFGILDAQNHKFGFDGEIAHIRYSFQAVDALKVMNWFALSRNSDRHFLPNLAYGDDPAYTDPKQFSSLIHNAASNFGINWEESMDRQVIDFFIAVEEARSRADRSNLVKIRYLNPFLITPPPKLLESFSLIAFLPYRVLCHRFCVLKMLNAKIAAVLPVIDFNQAAVQWSLANRISNMRSLIFYEVKQKPWNHILRITESGSRQHVQINRPKALRAREKGDPEGRRSIFGQVYRQLHFNRPSRLRTSERPWNVNYIGEGGTDAGGLFRDSISALCEDIQSDHLPLFVKCANSRGFGDNQEKFVPNPSSTLSLFLSMYRFIGKLMGVAIRGGHTLNLDFPSIVWKPLVGQKIDRSDLRAIDTLCCEVLDKVEKIDIESVSEETFREYIPYNFVTVSSDGREIELKENGHQIPVTFSNRKEFITLMENFRLKEFETQVNAIREGLATIVPIHLLPLFTWEELELMVCGKRVIDIDYLKENTRYRNGVQASDPHVQMLWEVLQGFSHVERQKFLRFVWGQSRLPYNSEDFKDKFIIENAVRDGDFALPVSHTCFFSLELPKYSSALIMRQKLLYAINEGLPIDNDHAAENVNWEED